MCNSHKIALRDAKETLALSTCAPNSWCTKVAGPVDSWQICKDPLFEHERGPPFQNLSRQRLLEALNFCLPYGSSWLSRVRVSGCLWQCLIQLIPPRCHLADTKKFDNLEKHTARCRCKDVTCGVLGFDFPWWTKALSLLVGLKVIVHRLAYINLALTSAVMPCPPSNSCPAALDIKHGKGSKVKKLC